MGGCLEYAVALQRRHSHLRFGSFGRTDTSDPAYPSDDVQHHFAHDDTHAYDSAGAHLLPYLGIAGEADFCRLDEQASWYEMPHEPEVLAALDHINRHPILKAGTTMSDTTTSPAPAATTADEGAWGILVRMSDMKRGEWLTPSGHLTGRKVHASLNWGPEGKAKCEQVAKEIAADHPTATVTVRKV